MNDSATPVPEHYSSTTRLSTIREIWQFRRLLLSFVARDLKVKYQRSALGLLWTLLNPLLMVLVFVTVFTSVLRIGVDGFWAFLISGIFAYQYIATSISRATFVLRGHAALRRSVAFPTIIILLSSLLALLVEFLVEIAIVMIVIFIFFHKAVPIAVVLLPWLVLLQFLMAAGLMFSLSVISVMFYDIEHAMPAILRLLFFMSPIMYPMSMVPDALRSYFYLNPLAGLLELYHEILYNGTWPSWELLGGVTAVAIAVFLIGLWVFLRLEDVCVEIA